MEQHLAVDLMRSSDSNRLGIIQAVIHQTSQQALECATTRCSGQTDQRFYLLLRQPRNLVLRLPQADTGKTRKYSLYFFTPGTPEPQMGQHLFMLLCGNHVSNVVCPLSNIEMARLSHKLTFFFVTKSIKEEYGFRVRIPLVS